MDANGQKQVGIAWFVVAGATFLAGVLYVVVATLGGSELLDSSDDVPLLILGLAGVISLAGWWREREKRAAADEGFRLERERHEAELRHREEALERERERRSRSEEAHQAERNWRQELHAEIARTYRERGSLGDPSDVPSMVLRLTKSLVDAEKGLLFWREDNGEDKLALAAVEGFEHSPEDSALVQRFAVEALQRDQMVREENPGVEDARRTEADEEIKNLLAVPIYLQDEFNGVVVCANNPDGFGDFDDEVLLSVGDQAGMVLQNEQLRGELRASYLMTVGVLADTIEVKDPFLRGHSEEVASYVAVVAERLDLPPRRREELLFGSLLHDIGKIGVSERILLKPGTLTPEEFEAIKLHPRIGYRLIQQVPALKEIAPAILYHHERFDGGGYPSGLRGEDIPLEARIICVADSFSAMIAERPYRERMTLDEACAELERCAGTQFDPEVVRVFVEEVRRRPPRSGWSGPALEDSELELRRSGDEPIIGDGTLALTDNLTLLYTSRYFHEIAQSEARRSVEQERPFGVVLIELAEIDALNRRAGYAAGDQAIQTVAQAVQRAVARHGGTACRYGDHRLGLIVPGADEQVVPLLTSEISADIKDGPKVRVVAATWRPGDNGDSVIDRARALLN